MASKDFYDPIDLAFELLYSFKFIQVYMQEVFKICVNSELIEPQQDISVTFSELIEPQQDISVTCSELIEPQQDISVTRSMY